MYYTNKEIFVLSAVGCMDTERDGLESILAGNDEGAKGCCLSVDMTADGIAGKKTLAAINADLRCFRRTAIVSQLTARR